MRIAYSKIGRSWNLDKRTASTVGGDLDVIRLLDRLAWDHPEHQFWLVGRNSGEHPRDVGLPDNVINPWNAEQMGRDVWVMPKLNFDLLCSDRKAYEAFLVESREATYGPFAELGVDAHVMWLGQHANANTPIPMIGTDWDEGKLAKPQMAFLNYCGYLLDFVQKSREYRGVEPLLLCPDPRNNLKAREMRYPLTRPILAQYNMTRGHKLEQFGAFPFSGNYVREQSVIVTDVDYTYAALEMTALDNPMDIPMSTFEERVHPFGLISNENRKEVTCDRLSLVKTWLDPHLQPYPIHGTWSQDSQRELGRSILPVGAKDMYPTLRSFKSTITLPASGSGWATAKPWEAFASGTVCFFHSKYDDQGHIIPVNNTSPGKAKYDPDACHLSTFLRVSSPLELYEKVSKINEDLDLYHHISGMQRAYFERKFHEYRGGALFVERTLGV